jgi:tRNA nucleotidyltransferase/poly(A) polymerase
MIDFFQGPMGEALKQVVETLAGAKFESYLAGGCVRDYLLNRSFKDIDIATNAKPDELIKLFPNHIPVGKQFGIIIVLVNHFKFEIATFRTDGDYVDGRHPQSISFASAEEDAKRRDFTINALFFDLKKNQIIDYVNGTGDLKSKIIRAVGDPHKRFSEDYLRILRALRFKVQLEFEIEAQTWQALSQEVKNLNLISGERISDELYKGLEANPKVMVDILESSGAWTVLFFSYLGTRSNAQAHKLNAIKSKVECKGTAFAFLLLQSESINKLEPFDLETIEKIKWAPAYENILKKINDQLKLSREDFKILKYSGAAGAWTKNWQKLRPAFRYEILAMPENKFLPAFLLAFGLDPAILSRDLLLAQNQPPAFLTGVDVEKIDPKMRGGVLKECFYLQWEQKLTSRAEALKWLELIK